MDVSDDSDLSDSMSEATKTYKLKHNKRRADRRSVKLELQSAATRFRSAVDVLKLAETQTMEDVAFAESVHLCATENAARAQLLADTATQFYGDDLRSEQDAAYAISEAFDAAGEASKQASAAEATASVARETLSQIRNSIRDAETVAENAETAAARKDSISAWRLK